MTEAMDYSGKKQHGSAELHAAIARRVARVAKPASERLDRIDEVQQKARSDSVHRTPIDLFEDPSAGVCLDFEALPPMPAGDDAKLCAAQVRLSGGACESWP
jgi:hypothetical protein